MNDKDPASQYSDRADAIGDSIRVHLIALHTGGLGAGIAAAATFYDKGVQPGWIVKAGIAFAFGLFVTVCSLFLQKHKALKRRDAAKNKKTPPDFTSLHWRNFTWDLVSLGIFLLGVLLALCALPDFSLPKSSQ